MNRPASNDILRVIHKEFKDRSSIDVLDIIVRPYPEETNYIVFVHDNDFTKAAEIGNDLDDIISTDSHKAFVVVRRAPKDLDPLAITKAMTTGVQDPRATELIRLISTRSRVSKAQPSLSYICDVQSSVSAVTAVTAGRHHLIFGRRGVGKTALLVEAKSQVDGEGALSCWINLQTYRNEPADRVFLYTLDEILTIVTTKQQEIRPESAVSVMAVELFESVQRLLGARETSREDAQHLIPHVARLMRRFLDQNSARLYIFLDDFYYLPRVDQPRVLDMINSCIQDCEAWIKVASIRHLTRWFQSAPRCFKWVW